MTQQEFEKLLNNEKYQIFIFTCPAALPIFFAVHPWIVINKKGVIERWEIRYYRNKDKNFGYFHLNAQPPCEGTEVIPFFRKYLLWKGKLVGYAEGGENSVAQKAVEFVEKSKDSYKYANKYFLSGPNSNTYVQWVLDHFPELHIKLPWKSFGKNIQVK